jgi:hypothetical protein
MPARNDRDKERVRQAFAGRFRKALMELGFSPNEQTRLQKLFGVSGQAARKWVEGLATPTTARMPEVARILGVRRAWLQDGEEPMRPAVGAADEAGTHRKGHQELGLGGDEVRLLAAYRTLTPELRNALGTVIISLAKSASR